MRRFVATTLIISATCLYAVSPFWAAWSLREAIRRGDVNTIEQRVQWDSLRRSLKATLANQADLLPKAEAAGAEVRPTLWQRVKYAFGGTMLDRFVESYVTPEGLPQLFSYQQTLRRNLPSAQDTPDPDALPWTERFAAFYKRVKRAEVQSLTRVEFELEDRVTPERRYVTVMELVGLTWKLTGLTILRDETVLAGAR